MAPWRPCFRRLLSSQNLAWHSSSVVEEYQTLPTTSLTLRNLLALGETKSVRDSAVYLHKELPKRLARRVKCLLCLSLIALLTLSPIYFLGNSRIDHRISRISALQALPFIVGVNPWIKGVFELYRSSFEKLRCFPEITSDDLEARFTATLEDLVIEHQDVTTNLARGFGECGTAYMSQADRTNFLDGMINARIGIRILAENHLALQRPADPEWIGVVHKSFSPAKLITAVGNHCREICNVNYGSSPEFIINGTGAAATFPYIPNHVEYIIMELMKNAMRATVEHSTKTSRMDHPPIEVTIVQGEDDIAIRLRDQGGGIPAPLIPFVFDYSFTTVRKDEDDDAAAHDMFSAQTIMQNATGGPMAGLGFGLPMSRNYAKYFGGSLEITSISGHGADVFIHLPDPFRTEKFLE